MYVKKSAKMSDIIIVCFGHAWASANMCKGMVHFSTCFRALICDFLVLLRYRTLYVYGLKTLMRID